MITESRIYGILYKEYLLLGGKLASYAKLTLVYWLLSILSVYPLWVAVTLGQMLMIFAPLALFSQEGSFQEYMIFCPEGRKNCVKGRYMFCLAVTLLSTLVTLLLLTVWCIFAPITLGFVALFTATSLGLCLLFLALPLFYAFSPKQARPWFFLLILTPLSLFVLNYDIITNSIQSFWTIPTLCGMILVLLVAFLLSLDKSQKIYQEKEFPLTSTENSVD